MAEFQREESTVPIGGDTLKTGETVNQSIAKNAVVAVDLRSVDQTRLMSCFQPMGKRRRGQNPLEPNAPVDP